MCIRDSYTGLHQTPEMIATAAVQEDVDVVGLSILSGAHMTLFPRVHDLLHDQGRDDILITGGGIIPKEDMDALREPVSYTHLRAHETPEHLVCRLLLEKKKK